ncbi:hypothetical protein COCVIDRAFT_113344 [Bipolaris victoriae FI3]|uniref:Uncharacterized protein n=1 Tax=Bipolaris victoriae (strain FI3) TaxID=930091 RepID=W7DUB9_BIPV3|nr:hypothetical protein COCVIDRAFT_113344 [Bipolaris victoriae FI3]
MYRHVFWFLMLLLLLVSIGYIPTFSAFIFLSLFSKKKGSIFHFETIFLCCWVYVIGEMLLHIYVHSTYFFFFVQVN